MPLLVMRTTTTSLRRTEQSLSEIAEDEPEPDIALVGASVAGICFPCIQDITVECNDASGNARFGILNEGNNILMRQNIVNGNAALPRELASASSATTT